MKGVCKATMRFGDYYGDNTCTFHCQLMEGHEGKHKKTAIMYGKYPYILEWDKNMGEDE